jgi:hypothetical protein
VESYLPIAEPTTGPADPAWDEAFLRVQSYLRAYGLESPVLLNRATSSLIEEARTRPAPEQAEPVSLAMEVARSRIGAWFAQAGLHAGAEGEQTHVQGRLALIIADLPGRWANHFLSPDPVPGELVAAMSSLRVLPGPDMRPTSMSPEPLEFGIMEPGDTRLPSRRLWVPLRVAASWLVIFGLFGLAWAAAH